MKRTISTSLTFLFLIISAFSQVNIPAESLRKHVYFFADDSLEGRGFGTKSGLVAANYIAEFFEQEGIKPIGENYFHPFHSRVGQTMLEGNNVVGIIEGSDHILKEEYIVLGAHFDHISYKYSKGEKVVYNGADDNATGTSTIMEIGKALVQNKSSLKRSVVIVAFDAEESGLIGSNKFVLQNIVPVEKVKLMMSIDMVGRYAESNSLIMGAMASLKEGDELLFKIADKHGVNIKKTGKKISNRTDSKSFGVEGVPSLHVTSGIIGPYHKPEDDAETIDYVGMEKIAGLLYELTVELSNEEALEPVKSLVAVKKNGGVPLIRAGASVRLGSSHHDYPDEFFQGKSKISAEIGLLTQIKLSKNFSIQPEVLYSTLGSEYNSGSFRTHSITTPVQLIMATRMNKSYNQRNYLSFGGYYSYHFAGAAEGESLDFDNVFEQTEYGLQYGIGMEVMSVFMNVNFKYGLSNLLKDDNLGEIVNRGTYLTIGYIF